MLASVGSSVALFQPVEVPLDLLRRAAEVKIVLIESGGLPQPLDIEPGEPTARQRNEVVLPEPLHDAVDVHGGQAERVGEFHQRRRCSIWCAGMCLDSCHNCNTGLS
jgi:hypothetical protein